MISHFQQAQQMLALTFPGGEVRSLEQSMLEDTLYTTKGRNDINTVVVQLPQLSIVTL